MCDYSLEAYASRPAIEGEILSIDRFPSGCQGMVSRPVKEQVEACAPGEAVCVVCLAPHTLLNLNYPDGSSDFAVFNKHNVTGFYYADHVVLSSGRTLLLTNMPTGTTATVLETPKRIEEVALVGEAPLPERMPVSAFVD